MLISLALAVLLAGLIVYVVAAVFLVPDEVMERIMGSSKNLLSFRRAGI